MSIQPNQREFFSARLDPSRLQLLTIGFCTDLPGEEKLKALGIERIWRRGDGANNLEDAIYDFRGRLGTLAVTDDLRIFGGSNSDISKLCAKLERDRIAIVDIRHPEMVVPELQDMARKALHSATPMRNHRTARRRGSMGGKAKAANAAARRRAEVSDEIACRVWQSRLTKKEKADILRITISTGDRHYGGR